jgi:glutamine cyclotransferase
MAPAVQVAAEDANNTTLTSFTGGITLAIGSGPGKLSGTTTQPAVSGVATFSDLSINQMANGYTLVASPAGGVASATSNAFNIDGLLFAGSDHNTFALTPLPDQLGRFTVNGPNQDGVGVILSVPYHINGMAQTGKFLYAGDPNTNTLRSIDFNGNPVSTVFSGNVSSVAAGFPAACCNEDMAFDGNVLWHAHFNTEIEKLDPATGALMATTLSITNTVANGTTAVFTVPNTVNLIAGQNITVTGCTTAGLNATYTITSVTSTTVTVPSAVNVTEAEPAAAQLMSAYGQPGVVGITFVGNTIWITHWSAQQVGTWDPATNTFTMKFSTAPSNAGGLAYDPVNGILWVGLQGGSIVPYNPVTGSPLNAGFSPLNTGGDTVDGLEFVSKTP